MFGRSNVLPCLSQSKFISADALLRHRGNALWLILINQNDLASFNKSDNRSGLGYYRRWEPLLKVCWQTGPPRFRNGPPDTNKWPSWQQLMALLIQTNGPPGIYKWPSWYIQMALPGINQFLFWEGHLFIPGGPFVVARRACLLVITKAPSNN